MTTSFNAVAKASILTGINYTTNVLGTAAAAQIRIYPSTVAFPTAPVETGAALPAGHILSYTGMNFSITGSTIGIISGTTTTTALAAGTAAWWACSNAGGISVVIGDSISLSGGGGVVVLSTLTPTSGQSVTVSLNLTLV
jgi:hypothetical protein